MFHLEQFTDYGLLLLRVMAGAIYVDSGYKDLKDPDARSKSIEMPKGFVIFLAVAELAGGAAVILGVLQQLAAIGLMLDHARRDSEENLRVENGILGQRWAWLVLRDDARLDAARHPVYERRPIRNFP